MTTEDMVVDVSQDWVRAFDVQQRLMQGLGWTNYSVDYAPKASHRSLQASNREFVAV